MANGDDAGVGAEDDGWYKGQYVWADQKGQKPKKSDPPKGSPGRKSGGSGTNQPPKRNPPCTTSGENCGADIHTALDSTTAEQWAHELIVRLQLPTPTPQIGPNPADNEWNMVAVGYPIWLWTNSEQTITASQSAHGYTFTLQAHYRSTTFDLGDGTTKQCTQTSIYQRSTKPGSPSPTCGHTYLKAPHDGTYTVTATTHWDIEWSVAGFTGTLPGTHTANRQLPVGELQAIVVG